jgi:hypothetical protein
MDDLTIIDVFDHQCAYEQLWRLRSLQARYLEPDGDPDIAEQLGARAAILAEPAADYLDDLLRLLDLVTGKALDQAYRDLVDSGRLVGGAADYIGTRLFVRDDFVEELRTQIESTRGQITGTGVVEFVPSDAMLGAGAALVAGGLAVSALAATAPATVPAVIVVGGTILAGAATGAGIAFIVDSLASD